METKENVQNLEKLYNPERRLELYLLVNVLINYDVLKGKYGRHSHITHCLCHRVPQTEEEYVAWIKLKVHFTDDQIMLLAFPELKFVGLYSFFDEENFWHYLDSTSDVYTLKDKKEWLNTMVKTVKQELKRQQRVS
jgi:hypothetical protein